MQISKKKTLRKDMPETEQKRKEMILQEYKGKQKTKPLTTADRLDRIEKYLGID